MKPVGSIKRKRIERLTKQGFALLKDADYQGVLRVAEELEELRFTAAFELAAQAHAGLDDLEEAVRVLERGVEAGPDAWLNWNLLGNYRSDLGRYDEAEEAYRRALECPGAAASCVRLNQAILAGRRGRHQQALEWVDQVEDPELRLAALSTRITALEKLGRIDEAWELATATLEQPWELEGPHEEENVKYMGGIAASLGRLRLERGESPEDVRSWALESLESYGGGELLELIRTIDGMTSDTARCFEVLIHVRIAWSHPMREECEGYYVKYQVIADTSDEALRFIREMERNPPHLIVEESDVLEPRPGELKGVIYSTGRAYYAADGDDEDEGADGDDEDEG